MDYKLEISILNSVLYTELSTFGLYFNLGQDFLTQIDLARCPNPVYVRVTVSITE